VTNPGSIYVSVDSGVTLDADRSLTELDIRGVVIGWLAVSRRGQPRHRLRVADSAVTWTLTGTPQNWSSVASSSDGTKLVAVANPGYVYTYSKGSTEGADGGAGRLDSAHDASVEGLGDCRRRCGLRWRCGSTGPS